MGSDYFPVHAHSAFSAMDGMQPVQAMVEKVARLGMPAMALTDHGMMPGTVQGYKECQKAGIGFFPGSEFYLVRDVNDPDTRGNRWHIGMVALNFQGLVALNRLSTLSWQKNRFYVKPLIDLNDLAFLHDEGHAKNIAVTTGCYSGIVVNNWQGPDPQAHADSMISMLKGWFPNLYVELQNHSIRWPEGYTDGDIVGALWDIAQRQGLPVVVGADSHYIDASEQPVHDLMKDICYFGAGEDSHFNGGPYSIESWDTMKGLYPEKAWDAISAGHGDLLDKNELSIPALDNYKFHVPKMHESPNEQLRKMAYAGLDDRGVIDDLRYIKAVQDELAVIQTMGYANYFILCKTHVIDWCRNNDVIVNARGSANGSVVCWAIGITNVDPLVWHTDFDRFLSVDRKKPPDVDFDVPVADRGRLIDHLLQVFPDSVHIGTFGKIGLGKNDEGEDAGSVLVQYMAAFRKKDPKFDGKVKPEHWDTLHKLSDETLVYKGQGRHAAGLILPGDGDLNIHDYLPLSRIIKVDKTVTQYMKDDVDSLGFTKIDILGLGALQTLNKCLELIGRPLNEWDWIPFDDKKACALLRSGNGTGLFQFEGFSTMRGGKEVKIKSTQDVIFTLALYRPALMNGGQKDLYLYNRSVKPSEQQRLHPIFDPILADTAGVPLYQEQITGILKTLGMAFEEYNELMSAIKASNGFIRGAAATFERLMPLFYDLCEEKGLNAEESDDAWGAVVGFTEYGFNRAHSTSYGLMAYYSAYLKAHYPLEYMAALLNVWAQKEDKVRTYTAEARRHGIRIVKADVNDSDVSWSIDPGRKNALRKGLISIRGVGPTAAEEIVAQRAAGGPFLSVQDFLDRTPRKIVTAGTRWKAHGELIGVAKALMDAGAFRSLD